MQESGKTDRVTGTEEVDRNHSDLSEPGVESGGLPGDITGERALFSPEPSESESDQDRNYLKAVVEAAIYITDQPLTPDQMAAALEQPLEAIKSVLAELVEDYTGPDRGLAIREIAGGYKMSTKPEHHEAIRRFVKKLQPPLKLSLPALETLAVIAYKQPITAPEIMEIRGVQGTGVLKTLLDRKLVATSGRKDVVGKPILYKTTKEFLVQFGLSSLKELPTLKEFEELGRLALTDEMAEPDRSQTSDDTQSTLGEPQRVSQQDESLPDTTLSSEMNEDVGKADARSAQEFGLASQSETNETDSLNRENESDAIDPKSPQDG
jgi:segregation and condensation protein B